MARAELPDSSPSSPRPSPVIERFGLTGPSTKLDLSTQAWRRDLADVALAGTALASHYARPVLRTCTVERAEVHAAPSSDAACVGELAQGERFALLDQASGWSWGYCLRDHRVGYVSSAALARETDAGR